MSDLQKAVLKKGKPPLAVVKKDPEEDDSGDEEEEAKDTMDPESEPKAMSKFGKGPIKPTESFSKQQNTIGIPKPK